MESLGVIVEDVRKALFRIGNAIFHNEVDSDEIILIINNYIQARKDLYISNSHTEQAIAFSNSANSRCQHAIELATNLKHKGINKNV